VYASSTGDRLARLTGIAGLATFVLIVVSSFVAPPLWEVPGTNATGAQTAAYAFDHRARGVVSLFMFAVAVGIWLAFSAGLWSWMRAREPEPRALSAVFAFATVAMLVMIVSAFVPVAVLGYRLQDASAAGVLADTGFGLLALSGIPTAVSLGAYAAFVLKTRCLPRWTAAVALPAALAHVFIAMSFLSHGALLSVEGSVIVWVPALLFAWLLAVSWAVLRVSVTARECEISASQAAARRG
jgi:hypothetical protein